MKGYKQIRKSFQRIAELNRIIDAGGPEAADARRAKQEVSFPSTISFRAKGKKGGKKKASGRKWSPVLPGSFESGKRR